MNREIKLISRYPAGHPSGKYGQISNTWGFNEYGYYHQNGLPNSEHIQCQYTGLKDKNGVEIYEGDVILMREQPDSHHLIFWDEKRAMYWDKRLEDGDSLAGYLDGNISFVEDGEVVRNIYEHPHLLNA